MAKSTTDVLNLSTLAKASPEAAEDFQRLIESAVRDCKERPGCNKARKVTLALAFTPSEIDPEDFLCEPTVTSKTPSRLHDTFRGRRSKTGQLHFDFPTAASGETE